MTDESKQAITHFGVDMVMPDVYENIEWLTRGPADNFSDRTAGYPVGRYKTTVSDNLFSDFINPTLEGFHQETRWMSLSGEGTMTNLLIVSDADNENELEANALHYTAEELGVRHFYQLPGKSKTVVSIGGYSRGVGGGLIGVMDAYALKSGNLDFSFTMVPYRASETELQSIADPYRYGTPAFETVTTYIITFDSQNGESPVTMEMNADGKLSGALPVPGKSGYRFSGWYTEDGTPVTTDTIFSADATIIAHWRAHSSGGGTAIRPSDKKDDDKKSEDDKKDEQKTPERQPDQSSNTQPTASFPDVKGSDWFAPAVDYVSSRGIMQGSSAGFRPNDLLTRGMIAQVIFSLEGSKPVSSSAAFTDVKSGDWYAPAAGWVSANGVMLGYSSGAFGANDSITREQLAVTLYQYAKLKGRDLTQLADLGTFRDGALVSDWAAEAVRWAVANGLLSGKSGGLLDPGGKAIRAEVASILMRFCENSTN